MFTNYLPSEMVTVLEVTTMFSFLVGTILVMLFTSDQANKKNLYLICSLTNNYPFCALKDRFELYGVLLLHPKYLL